MAYYPPNLNPFLVDDYDVNSVSSYNTAELPVLDFPPPPLPAISMLKLPAFWADAPVA